MPGEYDYLVRHSLAGFRDRVTADFGMLPTFRTTECAQDEWADQKKRCTENLHSDSEEERHSKGSNFKGLLPKASIKFLPGQTFRRPTEGEALILELIPVSVSQLPHSATPNVQPGEAMDAAHRWQKSG